MVQTEKGWSEEFAATLFTKEVTFDAGVVLNDTNGSSMTGFEADIPWSDRVESDKTEVTGKEHGTTQEIISKSVEMSYTEAHAKANGVAGFGALVLGACASVQDGTAAGYTHTITPVAAGSAAPSIQIEHQKGGVQYAYKGVKGNSIALSGEEGGPVQMTVELIGSGTRASSGTAMPSTMSEDWLLLTRCSVWMESGADIDIAASPTQEAQDISSTTPTDLKARIKSFSWKYTNNLNRQMGFGSEVAQDIDYVRRTVELQFTLLFEDAADFALYDGQTVLAIEFDLAGEVIDGGSGGVIKYGMQLIIPRCMLKLVPRAEGGVDDELTATYDCDVQEDGTNAVSKLLVYNEATGYIA